MKKEKKGKNFLKKPTYPGGMAAMRQFIKEHLKYPEEAIREKVEGTVVLKYSIGPNGKVVDARLISGLGHGCDEEAVRLAKMLKFEVPRNRGVKVLFHKDLKVHFRLPKQKAPAKPKATGQTVQYTYTTKKKEEDTRNKPGDREGGGYSYTISF